ncbi:hypothetical protein DXG03_003462 [Asterophora parasitica]|uniref:DUF2423 domain-containing protein n=1 Tax=Asterophora parasitica TaxID=117018 RepID=A0A9P7G9B2_9AGAR|nr:hypothetical protein DXG03_003462 [Asterophora parasitica]
MAKSIRSKAKRTFRSKKREDGVYAATEAARLHRLNAKLVSAALKEPEEEPIENEGGDADAMPGWCWFATLGLMDANDIAVESMDALTNGREGLAAVRGSMDRPVGSGLKRHISLA